jgi:hypothetical protein
VTGAIPVTPFHFPSIKIAYHAVLRLVGFVRKISLPAYVVGHNHTGSKLMVVDESATVNSHFHPVNRAFYRNDGVSVSVTVYSVREAHFPSFAGNTDLDVVSPVGLNQIPILFLNFLDNGN